MCSLKILILTQFCKSISLLSMYIDNTTELLLEKVENLKKTVALRENITQRVLVVPVIVIRKQNPRYIER